MDESSVLEETLLEIAREVYLGLAEYMVFIDAVWSLADDASLCDPDLFLMIRGATWRLCRIGWSLSMAHDAEAA